MDTSKFTLWVTVIPKEPQLYVALTTIQIPVESRPGVKPVICTEISSPQTFQTISRCPCLRIFPHYRLNRSQVIRYQDQSKRSPVCRLSTMSMSYANMIESRHLKVRIVSIFLSLSSTLARIELKWIADTNYYQRKRTYLRSLSHPSSHAFLPPILYIRTSESAGSRKNWRRRKKRLLEKFKSRREKLMFIS